jgi:hypothetical protein
MYLVVEYKRADPPRIIGLYRRKKTAERVAYNPRVMGCWRNVIKLKVW